MGVARSFSGGVAIRYILPVLWMTSRIEYCCQIWNPNYSKDIDLVEGVQRRATKLITGMQNLSYDDRVKHLGLIPVCLPVPMHCWHTDGILVSVCRS